MTKWRRCKMWGAMGTMRHTVKVKVKNKKSVAYCERAVKDGLGELVEEWDDSDD